MVLETPVVAPPDVPEDDVDTHLVGAVRRGDDRAFEELYTRYQRRISAYVFGMVKDHGRAEDITQEVFMSALRRMRETDRAIAFKPWIYEIAKNACIDQFRRSRRAEEVSFDAGEGLGGADHGRLVASDPSPDAAVDAKQQLEQLCGAFGGLSDSHHEILVLREFEGLSYSEIGDRMGLSRPGVESTLFRARKRLSEEYDELVSGQRCVRIQSIIVATATATASALPGARDARRLARHLAHCQPCRRQAAASGLDVAALARKPLRKRAAERIGALLPLPGFLRARLWPAGEQIASVSEPMAAGWSKAVAVAATLLVVGVGTGSGPQQSDKPDAKKPKAAPVASVSGSGSAAAAGSARARALGATASPSETTKRRAARRDSTRKKASRRQSGGAPGANAPAAGGGAGSSPTSATTPAAANTDGPGSTPARKPNGGGPVNLPAATQPVTNQVDQTVQQTGQAVTNTVGGVTDTVDQTVDTVDQTVDTVDQTVDTVDQTVDTVGGTAGNTVGGAGSAVGDVVDGATGAAGDAVDGVTGSLPNLGGG
jgi:RNA polymerase sigma factor (sigma-70 family)